MLPIALRDALASRAGFESDPRPLICYGYPGAAADASAACAALAEAKGLSYREARAPLVDEPWTPGEFTLAHVDCSARASDLSIERWSSWLSGRQPGSGAWAVALFSRADALDERGKEIAASLAFGSAAPCVFVSSAPTLCDLFSALRAALPPRALARVDFSAPAGSEAWSELSRLGAVLDAVDGRWPDPLREPRAIQVASARPQLAIVKTAPARGLSTLFERLGLGR